MRARIATSSRFAVLCAGCGAMGPDTGSAAVHARPNIRLIIGDDMGFSDVGHFGSEVSTPNVDTLAREG